MTSNKYNVGEWVVWSDIDGCDYPARIRSRRRGVYTLWYSETPVGLHPMPKGEGQGAGLMRGVPEDRLEPV
jgi:hypothetical protein